MGATESFLTTPVVGASVNNLAGEEIGKISDVVIDAATGRLRFAVVELPGEDQLLIMPWEALAFRPAERAAVLNLSLEKLKSAPRFARSEWPRVTGSGWDRETYAYYGYRPYWEAPRNLRSSAYEARHRDTVSIGIGVFLLLAITGLGSVVYRQGWSTTSAQVHDVAAAVKETTDAVRETSANVTTTAKVKTALALSKRASAFDIKVDTENGVATLTGNVPSLQVKELAGEIAWDTSGVREVRNLLAVDSGAQPD